MCGISGYIGRSKDPRISYLLISEVFKTLEVRGTDASGLWGTEIGSEGKILYHKEPTRSSHFVKSQFWKDVRQHNLDLFIVHARAATKGVEHAVDNANNHPFVSSDFRLGLVHNGSLTEAQFLKEKYQIESDTDSEFLLRMYEHGLDKSFEKIEGVPDDVAKRLNALREIWSVVNEGAMAVAIGERMDGEERGLFLFRNRHRPLWVADMRDALGQVFFFSSPDIWHHAVSRHDELRKICWNSQKLAEVPSHQIWYMTIDQEDGFVTNDNLFKFDVKVSPEGKDWDKGEFQEIKTELPTIPVITGPVPEPVEFTPEPIAPQKLLTEQPQCVVEFEALRSEIKKLTDEFFDAAVSLAVETQSEETNSDVRNSLHRLRKQMLYHLHDDLPELIYMAKGRKNEPRSSKK